MSLRMLTHSGKVGGWYYYCILCKSRFLYRHRKMGARFITFWWVQYFLMLYMTISLVLTIQRLYQDFVKERLKPDSKIRIFAQLKRAMIKTCKSKYQGCQNKVQEQGCDLNPIQDGHIWGCSRMGGGGVKRPPSLKSITHILQWWNLAQLYPT